MLCLFIIYTEISPLTFTKCMQTSNKFVIPNGKSLTGGIFSHHIVHFSFVVTYKTETPDGILKR